VSLEIGKLSGAEVGPASRLLARAFADDPVITHYLYDRLRRRVAFPAFFRAVLEELLPAGHICAAHDRAGLIGVAAWKPPDAPDPDAAARRAAALQLRLVRMMFPRASRGLFAGFAALEHFHPDAPHWYLAFVGVEPALQNRGVGRVLLAPVLKIADETTTPCYLETPFARTHPFYERLGFARHAEPNPFVGAPRVVVSFLREPGPVAQT
jgi:GNAT superfamily N-acetyltransferase